ncbi:hypothetical protein LSH36_201g06021 [Paralvinella palmiformis]|uniref:Syntaxin-8 n=1 Tax=Paralvinella palmiformis TaxID=53620 RepID=A0AAD9N6N8_9ANNE|nr:hypothetical protein LSH36_201g06021 [Paralvinella palmiformis]
MGDSWLSAYDACDRRGHGIMEKINERDLHPRGSSLYQKASANFRTEMMKFDTELESLKQELVQSATQHRLTHSEVDRRQVMIDKLITKKRRIDQAAKHDDHTGQRSDLFGPFADDDGLWGSRATSSLQQDVTNPFTSIGDIQQQQRHLIREQDEGLDALSGVLNRQKQMAIDIGNEVESQNELIDDIADHVDTTNQRLITETRHVRVIDKKSNTC